MSDIIDSFAMISDLNDAANLADKLGKTPSASTIQRLLKCGYTYAQKIREKLLDNQGIPPVPSKFRFQLTIMADSVQQLSKELAETAESFCKDTEYQARIQDSDMSTIFFTEHANINVIDPDEEDQEDDEEEQ